MGFLIETDGRQVLFDTGQSSEVLLHNLAILGFDPGQSNALILSHGHYGHTGGLPGLLERVGQIPLNANPDLFRERYRQTDTGAEQVGPVIDRASVANGVVLRLSTEPQEVALRVWTTGEITVPPDPEGRSRYHVVYRGDGWVADPYRDDLGVVLQTTSGLVLVCGCCSADLLNTLAHVRRAFGGNLTAVVGGIHLVHADAPMLDHVVDALRFYGPPRLCLGHCTGKRASRMLKGAFGDQVPPCQAGTVLHF